MKYLHPGPILSTVANNEESVAEDSNLARVPKVADFFPGMAETSTEDALFVKDLEK